MIGLQQVPKVNYHTEVWLGSTHMKCIRMYDAQDVLFIDSYNALCIDTMHDTYNSCCGAIGTDLGTEN